MIKTYVVTHDHGFAPNPQGDLLSLACCKPQIRRTASVGDWVVGTCPTEVDPQQLCFVAQVGGTATFDEYFKTYGPSGAGRRDAIYYRAVDSSFVQVKNAFHGEGEIAHDTKVDRVLICNRFWYFGDHSVRLPDAIAARIVKRGPSHRNCNDKVVEDALLSFVSAYPVGRLGSPRSKPKVVRKA